MIKYNDRYFPASQGLELEQKTPDNFLYLRLGLKTELTHMDRVKTVCVSGDGEEIQTQEKTAIDETAMTELNVAFEAAKNALGRLTNSGSSGELKSSRDIFGQDTGRATLNQPVHSVPQLDGQELASVKDLRGMFGLKKGYVYKLLRAGKIQSISKREPHQKRGIRRIVVRSVRDYLYGNNDSTS